ncbi:MAG: hypothetical protein Q8P46_14985 [Hyphomicrobiales bacterium]|nr:hypothetical protein [Hyphomicrobiales bacterium]
MGEVTMKERVARAIDPAAWKSADHRLARLGARNEAERHSDIADVMAAPRIVKSLEQARAAIEAMRTPTHEQGIAGLNADDRRTGFETCCHIYRAMIDKALA